MKTFRQIAAQCERIAKLYAKGFGTRKMLSAAGLRMINKVGLDAALKQAVAKGFVDWKDIKVIGD